MNTILPMTTTVARLLRRLTAVLLFASGYTATLNAQTCTIDVTGCPISITTPICANIQGATGQPDSAYVNWAAPNFALNCGQGGEGYNFQMLWDLPENKLAGGCWDFNFVQRTGQSGDGTLNMWKSTGSGDPYFSTPNLYFTGPTDIKVVLFGEIAYSVNVYFVELDGDVVMPAAWTINVPGNSTEAAYTNTLIPPAQGTYRLKFVFHTNVAYGGKTNYIDQVAIDAFLASTSCSAGIDFTTTGPLPGNYAVGVYNLMYTATYTPTSGEPVTAQCPLSFEVINNVPTITCPTVATSYNADAGKCYAEKTFAATAGNAGGCSGAAPTVEYFVGATKITFPYQFPVGTTIVKAVASNTWNKTAECTFNVVVVDNQPPVIGCVTPAVVYGTDPGLCTSTQSFQATATDNCGVANVKYYIGMDEITFPYAFPVGSTTVKAVATDIHALTSECSFTVVVADNQPPVITACATDKTINAGSSCEATVPVFTAGLVATDNCTLSGNLVITQSPAAGTTVGPTLGTPLTVTITVKDAANNVTTCTATLTVIGPIVANDDANATPISGFAGGTAIANVLSNDQLNCGQATTGNVDISVVTPASNAGVVLNTTTGAVTVAPGTPAGTYTITYRICDKNHPANCDDAVITVNVRAGTADLSITKTGPASTNSNEPLTYTITVTNSGPDVSDNTTITDNVNGVITGAQYSTDGGNTYMNWTGSYAIPGSLAIGSPVSIMLRGTVGTSACTSVTNTASVAGALPDPNMTNNSASATTTVTDVTPPVIACVADISTTANGNCSGAMFEVTPPLVTDNCALPVNYITGVRSDGKLLTDLYPVGTTTITWTAVDAAGNDTTCVQTLTVTEGTILANYSFLGFSAYPFNANETATGISSHVTANVPFAYTGSGIPSGSLAFKSNLGTNEALVMQPSSGENTRYLQYVISGETLKLYGGFKLYLQAERLPQGANLLTFAYSTDGTNYTNNGTMNLPDQSTWYEKVIDWSTVSALNTYNLNNLYIRVYVSGSPARENQVSDATRIEVDNFQVIGYQKVTIACAANVVATVTAGADCSTSVTVPMPSTNGRCVGTTVTGVRSDNKPMGDPYPIGVTTITWTAEDVIGNKATCTQTVTVTGRIDAVNDAYTVPFEMGGTVGNALSNDLLDCQPAQAAGVDITVVTGSGNSGVVLNTTTGEVTVAPATPAGNYTIVYKITDKADPAKSDEATISILVDIVTPVTGLQLKGFRTGGDIQLNWYTVTEQRTSHFVVERSFNGVNFQPLPTGSRVSAAGNSNSRRNYNAVDRGVQANVVYYRVRLYDADGTNKLSNVVAITQNISKGLRVFPNPVRDYVTVEFGENGTYQIDLISDNGQLIMLQRGIQVTSTFRTITLQRHNLISGQYQMRITNQTTGQVNTVKLVYLPNQTP